MLDKLSFGNDGVNSVVRAEMWRLSDADEPGRISEVEKNCQRALAIFQVGTKLTVSSPYSKLPRFVWYIDRRERNWDWKHDCSHQ